MLFILYFVVLAATSFVSAAPFKREKSKDLPIVVFADVLEQLESQFYDEGLKKFDAGAFASAGFVSGDLMKGVLDSIKKDEQTHSTALRSVIKSLGGEPLTTCKFNFDAALVDIPTMAATARVVENVGVAAYSGAAPLIEDKRILAAAASILPIEARHQTMLNVVNNGSPIPSPFDLNLSPAEVLSIAGPFISGCDLGIKPNPLLTVKTKDIAPGKKLEFESDALKGNKDKLFCQMLAGGLPNTISLPLADCCVPAKLNGPVAIWVTNDSQPLNGNSIDRDIKTVVAGPTLVFSDDKAVTDKGIGSLLRSDKGSSGESVSTQTISPSAASSIISSASGTASSAASETSAPSPAGKVSTPPNNAGGPNEQTGPASDGQLTVLGITKVNASDVSAGSSAAPSPSSSSSSGGGGGGGYGGY